MSLILANKARFSTQFCITFYKMYVLFQPIGIAGGLQSVVLFARSDHNPSGCS